MISTRMTVRICELLADGFTLEEAAEVGILPFFDASGGGDSERLFVKQVIQKHLGTAEEDIFNVGEEKVDKVSSFFKDLKIKNLNLYFYLMKKMHHLAY